MRKERYHEMMMGLMETMTEKVFFLGFEGAKPDLSKIMNMVDDLEHCWNNNGGGFFEEDWKEIFQIKIDELEYWHKKL